MLATRDLSRHTIRAYKGDLASFERFAGAETEVGDLHKDSLLGFVQAQRASAPAPASLRRRVSALKGFSRWLVKQGLIANNPWGDSIVAAGRGRRLPRVLPGRDLDRL